MKEHLKKKLGVENVPITRRIIMVEHLVLRDVCSVMLEFERKGCEPANHIRFTFTWMGEQGAKRYRSSVYIARDRGEIDMGVPYDCLQEILS
jgi:hypothetical protein